MNRVNILIFVAYYLPGYKFGGPVRTIANMVDHLGDDALDFRIVTADRDVLDSEPYPNVTVDDWNVVGKAQVFYASPGNRSLSAFERLIRETPHDVLYLNSFFDPAFTLRPMLARRLGRLPDKPVVIAPRGEFSAGALALKRWKKAPYLAVARLLGLYRGVIWQASSEHEAADICRMMGKAAQNDIVIAPDLPPSVDARASSVPLNSGPENPLRVVFLSRITPKKNLDFALRVLAQMSHPVEFNIYGPVWDEAYWQQCRGLIQTLPANVQVTYHGGVEPQVVPQVMASHDLFFFPTRGENFGHVILEALSVGTPVVLSDQTPWRDDGAGGCTVFPLADEAGFAKAIEHFSALSPDERMAARTAALKVARRFVCQDQLLEQNQALFMKAAGYSSESEVAET